jgi:hypothetical protein
MSDLKDTNNTVSLRASDDEKRLDKSSANTSLSQFNKKDSNEEKSNNLKGLH